MNKSTLFWIAVVLAIFGAAVTTGHPAWGTVTGVAILLLAGAIAAGAIGAGAIPTRSEDYIVDRRAGSQKISNSLVGLSSAAILAVYAAGYHRTGSAADEFETQAARRRTVPPIAAAVVPSNAATPKVEALPTVPPPPVLPLRKAHPRSLSAAVPKAAPAPTGQATQVVPPTVISTADAVAETAAQPTTKPQIRYKDGTYFGLGTSNHGDIQASVVIQGGRIASTAIAVCATRYPCSWIVDLPGQVVARQSAYVDFVSGATESSDAFSYAVAAALSKARE
jgi:uncharacterized protein with FMN-binding domain